MKNNYYLFIINNANNNDKESEKKEGLASKSKNKLNGAFRMQQILTH